MIFLYITIPILFIVTFFTIHYFFLAISYKRELMEDHAKEVAYDFELFKDKLLGDNPGCENEEVLHPKNWEVNIC